jgi:hypothetical protein
MKVRYQLSLDGVGCLSVIVLAIAIHWTVATRLGGLGNFGGAFAWVGAFVAGLVIVGLVTKRDAKRGQ